MINPFPALPPGELTVHPATGGKCLGVETMPWGQSIRMTSSDVNTPLVETEVLLFNVESEQKLHVLDKVAGRLGRKAPVALRVNRRLARGISFGGTYQFSKSIDDASTVSGGGSTGNVAQDAFNLRAERALSNGAAPSSIPTLVKPSASPARIRC